MANDALRGRTVAFRVSPEGGQVQAFHHLDNADTFDVDESARS